MGFPTKPEFSMRRRTASKYPRCASLLVMSADQQRELEHLVRNGNSPQQVALRCRLLLLAQQRLPNPTISEQLNVSRPTVLALHAVFAKDASGGGSARPSC